jgi:hypothetical protein
MTISEIMRKAGVEAELSPEILDVVQLLDKYEVIEKL